MKRLIAVTLLLCLLCAASLADSLATNGGVSLDTASLPHSTENASAPEVYFISDISRFLNSIHIRNNAFFKYFPIIFSGFH